MANIPLKYDVNSCCVPLCCIRAHAVYEDPCNMEDHLQVHPRDSNKPEVQPHDAISRRERSAWRDSIAIAMSI